MFSPQMMEAAQKMMSNMKPEDMERMSQMAANMDPKVMQNMMSSMGAPSGSFDASQASQAAEQMKNMTPEQLQAGMAQAQQQLSAQQTYMLNAAEMLKNEGNTFVKNSNYVEALAKYKKALENLQSQSGKEADALKLNLLNNSALCHLKCKDFRDALAAGEKALKIDSRNFKALFRIGQAKAELGQLVEAVADVRRASELSPSDKAIAAELAQLREQLKEKGLSEAAPSSAAQQHEVAAAWQSPPSASAASSSRSAAPAGQATIDADRWSQAAKLMENPDMLQQATEAMSKLSPEDMERMVNSTPLPPGMDKDTMKSQMEQLNKNPEMMQAAMQSFRSLPEEERKKMFAMRYGAGGGGGNAAGGGGGGANPAAAMFDNPDALQAAVEMASQMGEEDMKRLNIKNPEEADAMRQAAAQIKENPDLAKMMTDMMKNMPPEQLQKMMEMSSRMRGGGGGGGGAAGDGASEDAGPPGDPKEAMANLMNDPDMMKPIEEMMRNMSPEALSSMAKMSGVDLDESKSRMVLKFLPWLMRLMRLFGYIKKACAALFSQRGRIILAVLVLAVAMLQHFFSSSSSSSSASSRA